jgi:hypothetical protein
VSTEWRKTAKRSVAAQREMLKRMDGVEAANNLQKLQCIADHGLQKAAQMIGDEYDDDMSKILEPSLGAAEKAVAMPTNKAKGPKAKLAFTDCWLDGVAASLEARGAPVTVNELVKTTEFEHHPISRSTARRWWRRRQSAD